MINVSAFINVFTAKWYELASKEFVSIKLARENAVPTEKSTVDA